jgi:VWFA-related protein
MNLSTMTQMPRNKFSSIFAAIFLAAIVLCAFRAPLSARARDLTQGQEPIHVGVNLVMLDATVKTKSGEIMSDLKKEDFELREDGTAQKISIFSRDELPLNVALVLDLSDSIGPFFGPLQDAANTTLAALKPDDEVALFTFSTEAKLDMPLTKDKAAIASQFGNFKAGGATNINDGIFVAAQYFLSTNPKGRRVIILISDDVGTDAGGQGTKDIVTETLAADASLYNLKIPGYNPPGTRYYAAQIPGLVNIKRVADETGGEIFDVQNVKSLDATFRAMIERIKTRYAIGYYTNAESGSGKAHKLDVRLVKSHGTKGKDYVVLARNSFYLITP